MTRTLTALVAVAAACATLTVATPAPAQGQAPAASATLRIVHPADAILNVESGLEVDRAYDVLSSGGPVHDVSIDLVPGDPGLTVEDVEEGDGHVELGDLPGARTADTRYLTLTATPGMHTLTLRLSGSDAPTSEVTVTIWGRGGPALPRRDSLAGFGFFSEESVFPETGAYFRLWESYTFLDDTWVRVSSRDTYVREQPKPYLPCKRVTETCERYAFDARTGAVQIGTDRGELRGRTLAFHGAQDVTRPARAGSRVAFVGQNLFLFNEDPDLGRAVFRLTLRKDGTFVRVSQHYLQKRPSTLRGRYRIGQHGLLVARTDKGKVVRSGLFFPLDAQGRPRPRLLGVYAFDVWFHPRKR